MLDKTVDISNNSQLSTTIRYILESDERQAVERFIRFSDVSSERSATGLFDHINAFIQEFDLGQKLIAQT